jgi:hypothetical protein
MVCDNTVSYYQGNLLKREMENKKKKEKKKKRKRKLMLSSVNRVSRLSHSL